MDESFVFFSRLHLLSAKTPCRNLCICTTRLLVTSHDRLGRSLLELTTLSDISRLEQTLPILRLRNRVPRCVLGLRPVRPPGQFRVFNYPTITLATSPPDPRGLLTSSMAYTRRGSACS